MVSLTDIMFYCFFNLSIKIFFFNITAHVKEAVWIALKFKIAKNHAHSHFGHNGQSAIVAVSSQDALETTMMNAVTTTKLL
jgi:hypothetical protein